MNHGHFGPVRFITSVEVPKFQQHPTFNSLQENKDGTNTLFKTIAISGGEGYEEYKSISTLNTGNTVNSNAGLSNSNEGANIINNSNLSSNQLAGTSNSAQTSTNSSANVLQSQNSFNAGSNFFSSSFDVESTLGKDDLVNYVLAWEL